MSDKKFCDECGTRIVENSKFCGNCGKEFDNNSSGRNWGMYSIVSAIVALLFLPPIFAVLGIIFGAKAISEDDIVLGLLGVILSIIFGLAGMALGMLMFLI